MSLKPLITLKALMKSCLADPASPGRVSFRAVRLEQTASGQSLVEFLLVTMLLVTILLGGFAFGLGTYQAQMSSDAIQLPALHKMEMAQKQGAVNSETLLGYARTPGGGSYLDSIQVEPADPYTAILKGQKAFNPLVSFLPGFTIHTAQVINQALLEPTATGGASGVSINTPPLDGPPVMPPWLLAPPP